MPTIEEVEQLKDRIKIRFHFFNGVNIQDEYPIKEVLYTDIPNLPSPPPIPKAEKNKKSLCCSDYWAEPIFISKVKKTIIYHFIEWQESQSSRRQDIEGGPYLKSIIKSLS